MPFTNDSENPLASGETAMKMLRRVPNAYLLSIKLVREVARELYEKAKKK